MIKKALYSLGGLLLATVLIITVYLFTALPDAGPVPEITVEGTHEQIERGKYLAYHVSVCIDCHSERDWSKFSGPLKEESYGMGGDVFDENMGLPGTLYAKNITPTSIGNWTDGELYHIITTGINKKGEPIFPFMPYVQYRYMDPDDVKAIIAYIRTLQPIEHEVPESSVNFPVNLIMRTIPEPPDPIERPSPKDVLAYGKYMTTIAACTECHTPKEQGAPVEGMYMAGGFEFGMPGGTVRSSNITPHNETGIGLWTEEQFVQRFKMHDVPKDSLPDASSEGYNTIMPWQMYGGMKVEDLKAIYAYLQSLESVDNKVVKFTPKNELTALNE
ncbi:MAG: c-type cytochrome [Balneolaceae bacterium]|nr:c-type cytochrome [Balneolaceae bacterium]